MLLSRLRVEHCRCVDLADLSFQSNLIFITGQNGAGKTSLLEALFVLGNGRSFRTRSIKKVISRAKETLTVFALVNQENQPHKIGLARSSDGKFRVKIDGEACQRLAELSSVCPVFVVTPDFYDAFMSHRSVRMRLVDWGLFHVEHKFHDIWKRFTHTLEQRNALLKRHKVKSNYKDFEFWDSELSKSNFELDTLRTSFVERLERKFEQIVGKFDSLLSNNKVGFNKGSKSSDLKQELFDSFEKDRLRGSTSVGAHKANIVFKIGRQLSVDVVSRGQQKVLVNALWLAVVQLVIEESGKNCVVGLDDLPSELDQNNQQRLIEHLIELDKTQVFVTAISLDSLPESISGYNKQVFHVEHGVFQER